MNATIAGRFALLLAVAATQSACSSEDPAAARGVSHVPCVELDAATIDAALEVDPVVKGFMQTSVDARVMAARVEGAVKSACIAIAYDLGATDTWSERGPGEEAITNSAATGACDAATARIRAIMTSPDASEAGFALVVSRGACHASFEAQAACDAACTTDPKCDPGTTATRCDPGALSVLCDQRCKAGSVCEGAINAPARCGGACDATCDGACDGRCTDADGSRTDPAAPCHGKCNGVCHGTCSGHCTIADEDGAACGTGVRCRGECTTTYHDPVCETPFTMPACNVRASCEEGCSASVASRRRCEPPTITLLAHATTPAIAKLVTTLNAHLPALFEVADEEAAFVEQTVSRVGKSAQALGDPSTLDAKSGSCAACAARSASHSGRVMSASVDASVRLLQACRESAD